MMIYVKFLMVAVSSYFLGSFNTAVVVSKTILKQDIRGQGSGNAGATNALRVMGKRLAALVAAGDILKGVIAVLLAGWIFYGTEQYTLARMVAAAFVVLGHVYPVFFGFKGGKGVATTAAIMLVVDWRVCLIALVIFVLIVVTTKISALGSMLGAASIPFSMWYLRPDDYITVGVSAAIALFVIFLHRENIKRMLSGTENKVYSRKKKGT